MKKILLFCIAAIAVVLTGCRQQAADFATEQYTLENNAVLKDGYPDTIAISINFEYPTQMASDSVLLAVQHQLLNEMFGEAYAEMEPQQAMEAYSAMLITEYRENNIPVLDELKNDGVDPEEPMSMLQAAHALDGRVMGIVRGIMSYGVERYVYNGGAHGSNFRMFCNYDVETGKPVAEADFFVDDYEAALTDLLLECMIAQNDEIALIADLQEAGYNVDEIHPNGNFYLAEEGVTYVFNPYDIAPYALGETEILLPWERLTDLLR